MRTKIGALCIILGVVMLLASGALYLNTQVEATEAEEIAAEVLPQVMEQIPSVPPEDVLAELLIPLEFLEPEDVEMTRGTIDGLDYVGYISFPTLKLELPILADWDYDLLTKGPCRYTGNLRTDDLVLMAHNYRKQFGRLSELVLGDRVYFTDMDGIVTAYEVVGHDILPPNAVEEMTCGDYDLTLFTCTYGGKSRVTVYCDRTKGKFE